MLSFWLSFRLLPTRFQGNSKLPSLHLKRTLRFPAFLSFQLSRFARTGVWELLLIGAAKKLLKDTRSRVAQWKRAGPITQRSEDQNLALLFLFLSVKKCDTFLQNPERTRIVLVRTREYSSFWVFQEYSVCTYVLVSSQIIISSTGIL